MGLVLTVLHLLLTLTLMEEPRLLEEGEGREEGKEEGEGREQSQECRPEEGNNTDTCVGRVTSIQVRERWR